MRAGHGMCISPPYAIKNNELLLWQEDLTNKYLYRFGSERRQHYMHSGLTKRGHQNMCKAHQEGLGLMEKD